MINILTFKVGTKYDYRSVNLLKRSIDFHYDKPFRFFCMTDDPVGLDQGIILCDPMDSDFKYEFNSVSMCKSGFVPDGEPCILMDIDVEVVSDPSPIFDFQLEKNQIGFVHKWWNYPYERGSFISGMAYRFTAGELNQFYARFKANPEYYTNKYVEFNGRHHKIDNKTIHVRGEQDYFLECAGIYNFHMNLFPSFWAENVNPEIDFERGGTSTRLEKHLNYKSMNTGSHDDLIFKHYSGNIEEYLDRRYSLYEFH